MVNWPNGYNQKAQIVFYATYYIVLATKYGRRVLRGGIEEYLRVSLKILDRNQKGIRIFETRTNEDYLHMSVLIPPTIKVEQVVSFIKNNTAKALSEKFRFLKRINEINNGIWSLGCLVSTVEISEEMIQEYVEYQKDEDRGQIRFEFE